MGQYMLKRLIHVQSQGAGILGSSDEQQKSHPNNKEYGLSCYYSPEIHCAKHQKEELLLKWRITLAKTTTGVNIQLEN